MKAGALFVPAGVPALTAADDPLSVGASFVPAGMPADIAALDPLRAGAEFVPDGVNETLPFVPAGVKLTVALVGTPAGQEIAPSAKAPLAFVGTPAGHERVCVCADPAPLVTPEPVNVGVEFVGTPAGHATVPAGVPAVIACVDPLRVAAETPEAEAVNSFTPLPEVASASVPAVWECVARALPENVGTPAGHDTVGAVTVPTAVTL